jgi:ribosome-binding factor A
MPKEFSRTRRVGDQIQRELAQLIREEIKDPRVGMVTINAVDVSRDLGHAKVYVTTLDEQNAESSVEALNHAASFLRGELGRRMFIRTVPQLHFQYDESIERGARMSSLIEDAIASDREKAKDRDDD